jgi:hypothetical protein
MMCGRDETRTRREPPLVVVARQVVSSKVCATAREHGNAWGAQHPPFQYDWPLSVSVCAHTRSRSHRQAAEGRWQDRGFATTESGLGLRCGRLLVHELPSLHSRCVEINRMHCTPHTGGLAPLAPPTAQRAGGGGGGAGTLDALK